MFPSTSNRQRLLVYWLLVAGCCGAHTAHAASNNHDANVVELVDARIDAYLEKMVDQERFSGAVLVTRNGDVWHAKGYGDADEGSPNDVDTLFHVASITKQFTAAAILQLAEARALDLEGSINAYLPTQYRTPTWDEVRVRHLLSHSSGITDYAVTRDYYEVVDGFCLGDTIDGMIREAMRKVLEFAPGSQYRYSNIGFTLLGEIIEHQSGIPYEQYMHENIFAPMGMQASRIHVEGHVPVNGEAAGYRWDEDLQQHVKDDIVSLPVTPPDGGLVTTLSDFRRWIRIYTGYDQDVLSQASIAAMTSPQIHMGRGGEIDAYGYGLGVGERLIGHSGYIVGFRSRFDYARESDTLIVVFSNNTTNDPAHISAGILTILFSREP